MTIPPTDTPVVALIRQLYDNSEKATGPSWARLNPSLRMVMEAAIIAGMKFEANDFSTVFGNFNGSYWFGTDNAHSQGERFYSLAVNVNNRSASQSFESWKDRKPFIHDGKRLCIGSEFEWKAQRVTVTCFSEDAAHLVACSYRERQQKGNLDWRWVIKNTFKITVANIKAENLDRKERKELQERLLHHTYGGDARRITAEEILVRLGTPTREAFATCPIETIKKLLEELDAMVLGEALLEGR